MAYFREPKISKIIQLYRNIGVDKKMKNLLQDGQSCGLLF